MREVTDDELSKTPLIPTLVGDKDDLEEAWKYYTWMEACKAHDWRFLPRQGGLEDQEELLMSNIFMIASSVDRHKKPKG